MKIKSKGSIWNGYRRLYLKEYGGRPFIEFQFNFRSSGLGIDWAFGDGYALITLQLVFFSFCLDIDLPRSKSEI